MEGRRIDRVVLWREVIIGEVLDVECVYPESARELLAAKRLVSAAVDALFWPEDDMDDPGPHDLATAVIGATAAAYAAGVVDTAEVWRPLAAEWATGDFTDKGPELVELLLTMIVGHGHLDSTYPDVHWWCGVGDIDLDIPAADH